MFRWQKEGEPLLTSPDLDQNMSRAFVELGGDNSSWFFRCFVELCRWFNYPKLHPSDPFRDSGFDEETLFWTCGLWMIIHSWRKDSRHAILHLNAKFFLEPLNQSWWKCHLLSWQHVLKRHIDINTAPPPGSRNSSLGRLKHSGYGGLIFCAVGGSGDTSDMFVCVNYWLTVNDRLLLQ